MGVLYGKTLMCVCVCARVCVCVFSAVTDGMFSLCVLPSDLAHS